MPLTLVSTLLHVGRVQITCGLLPTRFSTVKKGEISDSFIGKIPYGIKKYIKNLHITHYYVYLDFSSFCLVVSV